MSNPVLGLISLAVAVLGVDPARVAVIHHGVDRDLGLRHDAGLEAKIEDALGLAEVLGRGLRDLELAVERARQLLAADLSEQALSELRSASARLAISRYAASISFGPVK
mgnify:CR=1 FL=1